MQVAENDRLSLYNTFLEQQLIQNNIRSLEKDYRDLSAQLAQKRDEYNEKFKQVCEKHSLKPELANINFKTGELINKEAKDANNPTINE